MHVHSSWARPPYLAYHWRAVSLIVFPGKVCHPRVYDSIAFREAFCYKSLFMSIINFSFLSGFPTLNQHFLKCHVQISKWGIIHIYICNNYLKFDLYHEGNQVRHWACLKWLAYRLADMMSITINKNSRQIPIYEGLVRIVAQWPLADLSFSSA